MRALRFISMCLCILCSMCCVVSCKIHEFPEPTPKPMDFALTLSYDTDLPLYKVIEYNESTRSADDMADVRYVVKAFDANAEGRAAQEELYHFEFVKDDITPLDTTLTLSLLPGDYNFMVWTDYVNEKGESHYYDVSHFEQIALRGEYEGSNDMRDAFGGSVVSEVSAEVCSASVVMRRPMAKFNFISTDVSEFISRLAAMRAQDVDASSVVDIDDVVVVFRYHGFVPNSFNMFTNKPADATIGVSFRSIPHIINQTEAELGFDYIFVNESEQFISISIEVYDSDGKLLANTSAIEVPVVRSKLTTVRAAFLTSEAQSGVGIDPGFDDEYNFRVD